MVASLEVTGNGDEVNRALRDVASVKDGVTLKTMKGILQRELRTQKRLSLLEAEVKYLHEAVDILTKQH